ncbi:MAG: type I restriction-modification system subunit M [Mycoplasmataceae bacterium]|nr:type I restriction-modification system subunit M [Mycoplasmataceae bacterium]
MINKINKGEEILKELQDSFRYIEKSTIAHKSSEGFTGLFDDIDLNNNKIGSDFSQRNRFISDILLKINDIEFNDDKDSLGDAYEYLISNFASDAGKKGGEFYTPSEVSKILSKITTLNRDKVESVYDPTCGSGSLLLKVHNETEVSNIYGQELNHTTFNLARMNMFLHGSNYEYFWIKQGDTIENDKFEGEKFDIIVANPPFGSKWSRDEKFLSDSRFSEYGELPPKSNADYVFLMHMLHHLKDDGVMATVFSNSVLSRGNSESRLREKIIKNKDYLDAVIGLPANLFFGTSIPAIIMVFKKNRDNKDILFIDASQEFEKNKNQNQLLDKHIEKIVNTYSDRKDIDKYSRKVSMDEIKENEYNLNISRYVDTFEEEEEMLYDWGEEKIVVWDPEDSGMLLL